MSDQIPSPEQQSAAFEEAIAYLREISGAGARLHGANDPSFRTICVLRD